MLMLPKISLRELILEPANEAVRYSTLIHFLSRTYGEVSQEHLMLLVNRLGSLIAMDRVHDREQIRAEMEILNNQAQGTEMRIREIIQRNRDSCRRYLEAPPLELE